jgi:hypothetical protein
LCVNENWLAVMRAGAVGASLAAPALVVPLGLLPEGVGLYGSMLLAFTALLLSAGCRWRQEQNRHAEVQEFLARAPRATLPELAEVIDALNGRPRGGRAQPVEAAVRLGSSASASSAPATSRTD